MTRVAALLALALTSSALCQEFSVEARATAEVTRYVEDWARNLPPRYRRRALGHVQVVVSAALAQDLDPLFVAVQVSCESSWDAGAVGKLGEVGLLQVHGVAASLGDTPLESGVAWLRDCIDACGRDLSRGLGRYMTGRCEVNKRVRYRMGLFEMARDALRKEE